ncbi:MAG: protein kinase [Myxococcales bacterium]|nr:protein kinase [Myxococcales bacterium]
MNHAGAAESDPTRVFVSYSHDDETHADRVLDLVQRLRGDGLDVRLDRFEPAPAQGWTRWMQEQIEAADFVMSVCSATYRRRFEGNEQPGQGRGVGWEAGMLRTLLYEKELDLERWVPVYFSDPDVTEAVIPTVMRDARRHVLPSQYTDLVARLTRTLAVTPAEIGTRKSSEAEVARTEISEQIRQHTLAGEATGELRRQRRELSLRHRDAGNVDEHEVLAGRYELRQHLGQGGFATVWRAYDRQSGDVVAVKVLHHHLIHEASQVERFEGGARQMMRLAHRGLTQVIEAPQTSGRRHFYVMPWYSNGDLKAAVTQGAISTAAVMSALADALEGLAQVHEVGLVHRDCKPSNILLDAELRGHLGDFDVVLDDTRHAITRTGAVVGSLAYAAPEQLNDAARVDHRADLYSAAMCVFFVLSGKDPPPMASLSKPKLLDELQCSERLRAVLNGAFAHEPERRTTTCAQLVDALRREAAGEGDEPVPKASPEPQPLKSVPQQPKSAIQLKSHAPPPKSGAPVTRVAKRPDRAPAASSGLSWFWIGACLVASMSCVYGAYLIWSDREPEPTVSVDGDSETDGGTTTTAVEQADKVPHAADTGEVEYQLPGTGQFVFNPWLTIPAHGRFTEENSVRPLKFDAVGDGRYELEIQGRYDKLSCFVEFDAHSKDPLTLRDCGFERGTSASFDIELTCQDRGGKRWCTGHYVVRDRYDSHAIAWDDNALLYYYIRAREEYVPPIRL